jgi:hypothetical protein
MASESHTSQAARAAQAVPEARAEPVRQGRAAGGASRVTEGRSPIFSSWNQQLVAEQFVSKQEQVEFHLQLICDPSMSIPLPEHVRTNYFRILTNMPKVPDETNADLPQKWSSFYGIMTMDDKDREKHHIAHVIPGWKPSANSKARTLTQVEVHYLFMTPYLYARSLEIVKVFLKHVGIKSDFEKHSFDVENPELFQKRLSDRDHNQLRMTRILSFLHTLSPVSSVQLFVLLGFNLRLGGTSPQGLLHVSERTYSFWRAAVYPDRH